MLTWFGEPHGTRNESASRTTESTSLNAQRVAGVTAAIVLMMTLTACGSGEDSEMPDVVGSPLDAAKSDIERAGYGSDLEVLGGGLFGIVDDSAWIVCEQLPAAGEAITKQPRLTVDRSCGDEEEPVDEKPVEEDQTDAEPTPEPSISANVVDTTVDELLDRLNSAQLGGIQTGDQFRFTGELMGAEYWSTGASGEYTVLFKAHGGADDLFVFVDQSETAGWTDGTIVEVVVESGEATINGETTDGWLRVIAVTGP